MGYFGDSLMYIRAAHTTPQSTEVNLANIISGIYIVLFFCHPTGEAAGVSAHRNPCGITWHLTGSVSLRFWGNGGPRLLWGYSDMRCECDIWPTRGKICRQAVNNILFDGERTHEVRLHGAAGSLERKHLHQAHNAAPRYKWWLWLIDWDEDSLPAGK